MAASDDTPISVDEAVELLRQAPEHAQLIRDSYLDEDTVGAAKRFSESDEFRETLRILGGVEGKAVLDLGAGTGIASFAFAVSGASSVMALEPDASAVVGAGAIERLAPLAPQIEILAAGGEAIPLPDASLDVVYARQVLHHLAPLEPVLAEVARVLRPGGQVFACREHVVDDARQLEAFLANHPVHQLAGGENAYPLETYLEAFAAAGLRIDRVLGPWDSVVTAFPAIRSPHELETYVDARLRARLGSIGAVVAALPGVRALARRTLARRREPGRLYAFAATRP